MVFLYLNGIVAIDARCGDSRPELALSGVVSQTVAAFVVAMYLSKNNCLIT